MQRMKPVTPPLKCDTCDFRLNFVAPAVAPPDAGDSCPWCMRGTLRDG